MKIYALINQKGGVGKTTTAVSLGSALSEQGMRVLVVDMDPQANATASIGIDKSTIKNGSYQVLIGATTIAPNIVYNDEFKLSILPASPDLSGAEIELSDFDNRESIAYPRAQQLCIRPIAFPRCLAGQDSVTSAAPAVHSPPMPRPRMNRNTIS